MNFLTLSRLFGDSVVSVFVSEEDVGVGFGFGFGFVVCDGVVVV